MQRESRPIQSGPQSFTDGAEPAGRGIFDDDDFDFEDDIATDELALVDPDAVTDDDPFARSTLEEERDGRKGDGPDA